VWEPRRNVLKSAPVPADDQLKIMISVTRLIRLGVRVAAWATPHVKEWHRQRHFNTTEGQRHLEARHWADAEKHLILALAERRRAIPQRIELLLSLQKAQRHQHKLAEAEKTILQAVALAGKVWERSWRSLTKEALADLQIEQTKYAEAEETIKEIQKLEEGKSAPGRARLARCSLKLAKALLSTGRKAEALEACKRAVDLSEQAHGADHLETANALSELGVLHQQHGNPEEALRCVRRALQIHRSELGADSQQATQDLHNLAELLEESGDYPGAMHEYERVIAMNERQVGGDRKDMAETQVRLAVLYLNADRTSAARELLIHAVATLERSGGDLLGFALTALAAAEEESGRHAEALRRREQAAKLAPPPVPVPVPVETV
jgi:tetratricopeptide (TPR) repeat protein